MALSSSTNDSYDVFLSFRSTDTRNNFTSHLHKALYDDNVKAFVDNNIERGEEITPFLEGIIERVKLSIIVFSSDYASSTFCLDEMVKIIECKETKGQIVLPIFYKVSPSEEIYKEAFARHERTSKQETMVERWRSSFQKSLELAGWHIDDNRNEARIIEEIMSEILKRLNCLTPTRKSLFQQVATRKESTLKRKSDNLPKRNSKKSAAINRNDVILKSSSKQTSENSSSHQWEMSNATPRSKFDGSIRGDFSKSHSSPVLEDSPENSHQNGLQELEGSSRRALASENNCYLLHSSLEKALGIETVTIDPGLFDSNSVDTRGVAQRLIYATILQQDEKKYFAQDFKENMNLCMEEITKVAQRLAVTCAQGLSVRHCVRNEEILNGKRTLRQDEHAVMLKEMENLKAESKKLKSENDELKSESERVKSEYHHIQEEHSNLKMKYEALSEEYRSVVAADKEKDAQQKLQMEKSNG